MKKLFICMLLCTISTVTFAQFEKNTWFVNSSMTGVDLSFNKNAKTHFGFEVNGGAFMMDNIAVLLKFQGDYGKHQDKVTALSAGGRYYFDKNGVFLGAALEYKRAHSLNGIGLNLEAGYAYFISKNVTLEPAVYYNQSFNHHSEHSRFGLKMGLGIYF